MLLISICFWLFSFFMLRVLFAVPAKLAQQQTLFESFFILGRIIIGPLACAAFQFNEVILGHRC